MKSCQHESRSWLTLGQRALPQSLLSHFNRSRQDRLTISLGQLHTMGGLGTESVSNHGLRCTSGIYEVPKSSNSAGVIAMEEQREYSRHGADSSRCPELWFGLVLNTEFKSLSLKRSRLSAQDRTYWFLCWQMMTVGTWITLLCSSDFRPKRKLLRSGIFVALG